MRRTRTLLLFIVFLTVVVTVLLPMAAMAQVATSKIREYRRANEVRILTEFTNLLALPNPAYDSIAIRANAALIMAMMKQRGIANVQLLEGIKPLAPPSVYGEIKVPGATRTVVFYAHYDGQPVNPSDWTAGSKPFEPILRTGRLDAKTEVVPFPPQTAQIAINPEWRIYARSASDDKGGVMAILTGYEALKASGIKPTSNIKFFFEGEEEAGSGNLGDILEKHKTLLASDLWLICDGPVHQSGRKKVDFGVRGDVNMDITVYGPKRPLHSGHYGNWAPNPAMTLVQLLASMKDTTGRVTIEGFYDDVAQMTELERKALAAIPSQDEALKRDLGIAKPDGAGKLLVELISQPSLNINGIRSANVGVMASNVIPTTAQAVLDLRLAPGNDNIRQVQKVIKHVRRQGFYVVDREPTDEERLLYPRIAKVTTRDNGYNAQRTTMDVPIARSVVDAVQSTTDKPVVLTPPMGGSLPLYLFEKHLNALTITVPIANHDNNQHAENENIRLQNLWDGIETMAALMTMK